MDGKEKKVYDRSRGKTPTSPSRNFDDIGLGELVEAFTTPTSFVWALEVLNCGLLASEPQWGKTQLT
jgi:hypothetical protein